MMKSYTLSNGYKVIASDLYDGCTIRATYDIYTPDGELYMKCGSYREAYELASHLKNMSYEDGNLER